MRSLSQPESWGTPLRMGRWEGLTGLWGTFLRSSATQVKLGFLPSWPLTCCLLYKPQAFASLYLIGAQQGPGEAQGHSWPCSPQNIVLRVLKAYIHDNYLIITTPLPSSRILARVLGKLLSSPSPCCYGALIKYGLKKKATKDSQHYW